MSTSNPEHGKPPRSHQDIFSDVHSLAVAIANMTEAVPVECEPVWETEFGKMKMHDDSKAVQAVNHFYAVVAYRWGDTNGHWYFTYVGPDQVKAVALAQVEVAERGGKYAAAVYQFDASGTDYELIYYAPSMTELKEATAPAHNHKRDYFERLGQFLDSACEGECLLPAPLVPGQLPLLTLTKVEVPEYMKQERARQRAVLHAMTEADRHEQPKQN